MPAVRWLHRVIASALFIQAVLLGNAAPIAAGTSFVLAVTAFAGSRGANHVPGNLYLTANAWCLVDPAGRHWRAPVHAAALSPFAFSLHLRSGLRSRWVLVTQRDCGTGPWRALRRAVTLYARPVGFKDRVRARLQCLGIIQREVQSPTLPARQRTANH